METLHWHDEEQVDKYKDEVTFEEIIEGLEMDHSIQWESYKESIEESCSDYYFESGVEHAKEIAEANDDGQWFFDKWQELSLLDQGRIAVMFGMDKGELETRFHDAMER